MKRRWMRKRKMGGGKDGRREKGKVDEEEEDGRREGWEGGGREGRWMRRMGGREEGKKGGGVEGEENVAIIINTSYILTPYWKIICNIKNI